MSTTSQRAVKPSGWGVKAGMVRVWVAGKTTGVKLCDLLVTQGPYLTALEIKGLLYYIKHYINSSVYLLAYCTYVTLRYRWLKAGTGCCMTFSLERLNTRRPLRVVLPDRLYATWLLTRSVSQNFNSIRQRTPLRQWVVVCLSVDVCVLATTDQNYGSEINVTLYQYG